MCRTLETVETQAATQIQRCTMHMHTILMTPDCLTIITSQPCLALPVLLSWLHCTVDNIMLLPTVEPLRSATQTKPRQNSQKLKVSVCTACMHVCMWCACSGD